MIDWAIIIGTVLCVAWVGWLAFRPRKRKDDPVTVLPELVHGTNRCVDDFQQPERSPFPAYQFHGQAVANADELAKKVHDYERAQERRERAEALLADVWLGQRPNEEDIKLLSEYFDARRVNAAMVNGMWASLTDAINDCTRELEALKAAQPTMIVAEMPERVG